MPTVAVPVFRPFTHPELKKVKLAEGICTKKEVEEMIKNTNFLIAKGLHVPGYRLSHEGREDRPEMKGRAIGWVEELKIGEDGRAIGYSDFTEIGKSLIRGKEVRWVSSGIRRDFRLTGEPDGPVLPGLYLDHVAVLGDENPAVKGLVDLSRVELSEGTVVRPGTEQFSINERDGEVCYFAEISSFKKEINMPAETQQPDFTAMFKELNIKVDGLNEKLATEKKRADEAEQKLKQREEADTQAKFAEYKSEVDTLIKTAVDEKKVGAEMKTALVDLGTAVFGTRKAEEAFKIVVKNLKPLVTPKRVVEPAEDDEVVEFADDGSNLSESDLVKAASDPVIGKHVAKIVEFRRKKDKTFSFAKLRDEVFARS
jgi:hypothetical protein